MAKNPKQPNRSTKPWGPSQLAKLRREYPTKNTAQLAEELGMHVLRVRWRASLMGLQKDKYGLAEQRRKFLDEVMAEYASSTAGQIAERRGVTEWTVRMWIREARHGVVIARAGGVSA